MFLISWNAFRRLGNVVLVLTVLLCVSSLWRSGTLYMAQEFQASFLQQDRYAIARQKARELDQKYLSGIVGEMDDTMGDRDDASNITASIVIGRLKNETDLVQWVYDELYDMDERNIYVVDDPSFDLHLDRNHGREAAVYLTHIVNNYDKLTDVTFFWHGSKIVWHNNLLLNWDSVETINRMSRKNVLRRGYVPSRCDQWPGCPVWIKFNPSKAEHRLDPHRLEGMFTPELFEELFPEETTFPPFFAGTCCSQFALSRDRIRSRPLSVYKRLLEWVLEYDDDESSGRILEYTWQYIFLGQGTLCPSMRECYCQTYDLCMEDQRDIMQLEKWNALRTRREEIQWQVNFVKDTITAQSKDMVEKNVSKQEAAATLELVRPEFERLSKELDRLSETTWLEREKIIHRWKLGLPPVGW